MVTTLFASSSMTESWEESTEDHRSKKLKIVTPKLFQLDDMLFDWICVIRKANLLLLPSLVVSEAKNIEPELHIDKDEFKASWKLFSNFKKRKRMDLEGMTLFWEGGKINKNDL